ncbi:hypothetical protein GUJ93_ZPchr0586g11359 [Zizania palustris]|uniref:Uncharacterized protein n=1 Tax=Zizania palustris TaxID=103762 RepID=A0A8J5QUM8_ZIZPA|nr:hypothetical protein GUJ93_ZPchr0586g11359 [Zizania palustris]
MSLIDRTYPVTGMKKLIHLTNALLGDDLTVQAVSLFQPNLARNHHVCWVVEALPQRRRRRDAEGPGRRGGGGGFRCSREGRSCRDGAVMSVDQITDRGGGGVVLDGKNKVAIC